MDGTEYCWSWRNGAIMVQFAWSRHPGQALDKEILQSTYSHMQEHAGRQSYTNNEGMRKQRVAFRSLRDRAFATGLCYRYLFFDATFPDTCFAWLHCLSSVNYCWLFWLNISNFPAGQPAPPFITSLFYCHLTLLHAQDDSQLGYSEESSDWATLPNDGLVSEQDTY